MKARNYVLLVIIILLFSCNKNNKTPNLEIEALSPYHYEFKDSDGNLDNINYYFLKGDFQIDEHLKKHVKDFIYSYGKSQKGVYVFNSVYIYKETAFLNTNYKGNEGSFDGSNNDLIAYARFDNNQLDVFYLLDEGNVIFDIIKNKEVDFEFQQ
ncbi:hypothetical protein ACFSX9_01315 [Flavobacterium ardleyense]|uniref:Lipoprotein n=1 Tax=Flavobacterium ardleyense TaxID=2038737 RepID=A0ABW5Z3G0_9FLAO